MRDAQGNLVSIDSARAWQSDNELPCTPSDGGDATAWIGQPNPTQPRQAPGLGFFECTLLHQGIVNVEVKTLGQTLTGEIEVEARKEPEDRCDLPWLEAPQLDLTLPGPGCPVSNATAVEGFIFDGTGTPAFGSLSIELPLDSKPCHVELGYFRCPALTAYSAEYSVGGRINDKAIGFPVVVEATDCEVQRVFRNFDLSRRLCNHGVPAVHANVLGLCPDQAEAPLVRAKILGDSEYVDCQVAEASPGSDGCLFEFECPALTENGSGTYFLEITQADKRLLVERQVETDGCDPMTNTEDILDPLE